MAVQGLLVALVTEAPEGAQPVLAEAVRAAPRVVEPALVNVCSTQVRIILDVIAPSFSDPLLRASVPFIYFCTSGPIVRPRHRSQLKCFCIFFHSWVFSISPISKRLAEASKGNDSPAGSRQYDCGLITLCMKTACCCLSEFFV